MSVYTNIDAGGFQNTKNFLQKAMAEADPDNPGSISTLNREVQTFLNAITVIVNNASLNGVNLINGQGKGLSFLLDSDGDTLHICEQNLTVNGLNLSQYWNKSDIDGNIIPSITANNVSQAITDLEQAFAKIRKITSSLEASSSLLTEQTLFKNLTPQYHVLDVVV